MLPGLNPTHTRKSFHSSPSPESSGARLAIERFVSSPEDMVIDETTGLWLLPPVIAELDVVHDIARADWLTEQQKANGSSNKYRAHFQKIAHVLGRSVVGQTGCVSNGLRGKQTPSSMVIDIAEFEMGTGSHNTPDEVPYLSACGNDDCYNARHHNLDFGGSRFDLCRVDLNPTWYRPGDDGEIETIWGDTLPSIEESLRHFIYFQKLNFPFVPFAESRLTPTPISQIAFHPLTGCWESYMYEKNSSGLANTKNGYGIMYARQAPNEVDADTGEVKKGYRRGSVLAHNLVWVATGNELVSEMDRNHLCNYTRCCNPLHLEQIEPELNRRHGHAARAIIRAQEKFRPDTKHIVLKKSELAELYQEVRKLYIEISDDKH
jgi:hypothetical protein